MPASATKFSPEVRRWAAILVRQRTPNVACTGTALRARARLSWAESVIARHQLSKGLRREGGQTLLRGTRRSVRLIQNFAPQTHVSWRASMAFTYNAAERSAYTLPASPAPERTTALQILPVVMRESQSSTTLFRADTLRQWTERLVREVKQHTIATTVVERSAPSGVLKLVPVDSAPTTRTMRGEPLSLVQRVLLKNVRIEEQLEPAQKVLVHGSASIKQNRPVMEETAQFQSNAPTASAQWGNSGSTPQFGAFNISQITDQVVRQLDSRLVAARERFGKI